MRFALFSLIGLRVLAAGCGEPAEPEIDPSASTDTAQQNMDVVQIKSALEPIVESGEVSHSGLYGLDESLKKAGKEDLIPELNKLGSAGPEDAKKIAKGIIDKL